MSRRVSEVGEGTDGSNGVYGLIRDLLVEGKDAWFVKGSPGRYVLNWSRALDRYADYKARKNPHFKSKNLSRRKASNGLRSALLNFYKKEGAKEYKEFKKVNDKDEVVERQFQMPPRVFESLFGNTVPSSGESGLSEQEDEQEINSITSEGDIDAQSTPNSSDHGFDETMDFSCCDLSGSADRDTCSLTSPDDLSTIPNVDGSKTDVSILSPDAAFHHAQLFDTPAVDSALDEICSDGISDEIIEDLDLLKLDICPTSGSLKGGYIFYISLTEPLSAEVSSGMAKFEGVDTVPVHKLNNAFTLTGVVPASDQPGDVPVTVMTQSGQRLGMAFFRYVDEMREVARQLVHDPEKQALWFAIWCQEYGFFGTDVDSYLAQVLDPLNIKYQDSSIETKQQHSVKVLQLLVYTAAQTNAKEFVEMIFSTSAGQIVFDSYKDRTRLPEDVARANGHDECAQYLHELTTRLSQETEFEDRPKTINWLELVKAVQNQTSVSSDTESKRPLTPVEKGDYSSDYFADAETSSFGSTEPDDMCPSHSEEGLFSHSYTLLYHPTAFESRLFEGPGICQDNNSRSSRRSSSDRYFTNIWSAVGLLALVVVLILVVWLGRDLGVSTYRDTVNTGCNVSSTFEIIISFVPSNDKVVFDSFITLLTTRKRYQPCAARQFYIQNDTCIDKTIHEKFEPEADHSHQCHAHQLHGNHLFQKPLSHGSPHRLFTGIALLSALLFLCISLTRLFYVISHMKGRYQSPSPLGSREETSKPLEDASMKELQMERVRAWLCDNDDSKAFVSARYSASSFRDVVNARLDSPRSIRKRMVFKRRLMTVLQGASDTLAIEGKLPCL